MSDLDDYEEGVLTTTAPTRKKWWQFWIPKTLTIDYARYTKIGRQYQVTLLGTHKTLWLIEGELR